MSAQTSTNLTPTGKPKLDKLSEEQLAGLKKEKDKYMQEVLNSGKQVTHDDVEPYMNWLYKEIQYPRPPILIANGYYEEKVMLNLFKSALENVTKFGKIMAKHRKYLEIAEKAYKQIKEFAPNDPYIKAFNEAYDGVKSKSIIYNHKTDDIKLDFTEQSFGAVFEYWVPFYKYFKQEGYIDNHKMNQWMEFLLKGVWSAQFYDKYIFMTQLPEYTKLNAQERLHNEEGPAIKWRDGFNFYFIDSVAFNKKLFTDITKDKLTSQQILQLSNIEQRRIALRMRTPAKILTDLKGKSIDRWFSPHLQDWVELFVLPGFLGVDAKLVKYKDPSTQREYVSFVPEEYVDPITGAKSPMTKASQAMATKFKISEEKYVSIPGPHQA
jgi:hypothetical protein